jgi:hypothetical protein
MKADGGYEQGKLRDGVLMQSDHDLEVPGTTTSAKSSSSSSTLCYEAVALGGGGTKTSEIEVRKEVAKQGRSAPASSLSCPRPQGGAPIAQGRSSIRFCCSAPSRRQEKRIRWLQIPQEQFDRFPTQPPQQLLEQATPVASSRRKVRFASSQTTLLFHADLSPYELGRKCWPIKPSFLPSPTPILKRPNAGTQCKNLSKQVSVSENRFGQSLPSSAIGHEHSRQDTDAAARWQVVRPRKWWRRERRARRKSLPPKDCDYTAQKA